MKKVILKFNDLVHHKNMHILTNKLLSAFIRNVMHLRGGKSDFFIRTSKLEYPSLKDTYVRFG